jgi:hypothetical protein
MRRTFFLVLITVAAHTVFMSFTGCKASEKSLQSAEKLEKSVSPKLGKHFIITYNSSKTHALCEQERDGDHSNRIFRYVVVKVADNTIVHEGSFRQGYVRWNDSKSLEVVNGSSMTGTEKSTEIRMINIESGQL